MHLLDRSYQKLSVLLDKQNKKRSGVFSFYHFKGYTLYLWPTVTIVKQYGFDDKYNIKHQLFRELYLKSL